MLGEFEQHVLWAVLRLDENAYGMTIHQEIQERAHRVISLGAIYTTLDRLEEKGLISSRVGDPTPERGGRAKKFFKIEGSGAAALKESYEATQRMARGLVPKLEGAL